MPHPHGSLATVGIFLCYLNSGGRRRRRLPTYVLAQQDKADGATLADILSQTFPHGLQIHFPGWRLV